MIISVPVGLAGKGKGGQGRFRSAKCMRKMRAKKKNSYEVGLQFTCVIGRLISDERSREGRGIKFYRWQEWG